MSEQDRKLFEMYGKKPAKNVLSNMQKVSRPSLLFFGGWGLAELPRTFVMLPDWGEAGGRWE
jgi:hypothetical protein